jgi:L-lactate dehydrogenase complex protein LldE
MTKTTVDIFIPCFMDQMYPETGFNMVKVLEKVGCDVRYNPAQTCCGQPAYNAGYFKEATEVAGKFLDDFSTQAKYIVSPSASCVGMVRNGYSEFFEKSLKSRQFTQVREKIFEFTEFLTKILGVEHIEGAKLEGKAAYHDACSALRECKIFEGPRKLLSHVEGLDLVTIPDNETCCGFGGTFAVKFDAISVGMAEQKVQNAVSVGAKYIISTDTSCLLHLESYIDKNNLNIKCLHIADVLATGW